ncbi:MAG TPA: hypothetical protein DCZ91_19185 [Lachnospiraceae bacterium]|nr:hypothetical protein [Lachnospiraceae bacterium]
MTSVAFSLNDNSPNEPFEIIFIYVVELARNLLRDVVGRYIGNESENVYALFSMNAVEISCALRSDSNFAGFSENLVSFSKKFV